MGVAMELGAETHRRRRRRWRRYSGFFLDLKLRAGAPVSVDAVCAKNWRMELDSVLK